MIWLLLFFPAGGAQVRLAEGLVREEPHLPAGDLQIPLVLQLFQLPHHGAAVGADVLRQGAEGEGQGKAQAPRLVGENAEAAQQLLPGGAAGEHLHPLAEVEGLFRQQGEEALQERGVVLAVFPAGVGQVLPGQ